MNVMINDISHDLNTTVQGVQVCITLFLLVMAALMIPCGKLTDKVGRKRCFTLGLAIYGVGAVISAVSPGLGVLILGNSIFEGVGTALLIPPVYILTTMLFTDMKSRAWAFGLISGMGGIGAAMGPLIGGLITTAISWRVAFVFAWVRSRQRAGKESAALDRLVPKPHIEPGAGHPECPVAAAHGVSPTPNAPTASP
jgi:MFS family permease